MPFFLRDKKIKHNLISFLTEQVQQGVSVIDIDRNIVFMNKAILRMMDIPLSILKENCSLETVYRFLVERGEFGPGDTEKILKHVLEKYYKTIESRIEFERPNGRVIDIQRTHLCDGTIISVFTDITEQRAYEAHFEVTQYELELKLENSVKEVSYHRDLLVNAINASHDGIIIFDENDCLAMANLHMLDLYPDLKRHLIKNSHISKINGFALPSQDETSEEALFYGRDRNEVMLHDNRWYRIEQSITINGGRIAVFSDISAYKEQTSKLQEHTNELVKMLQKEISLSETQREFVSMASHEFKTPLAIIDSNAQRIERRAEGMSTERLMERISNIRDSVERMQYLINRFMDFSSEEIAGLKLDARRQNFRSTLERLCKTHQQMAHTIAIISDLEALPDYANFDQSLLEQSVSNILSNATKYSEAGSEIRVIGKQDERHLIIEIHDQGIGIPEAELSKIFNKYYRASNSNGVAGTGIGLNFTQKALQAQGGRIDVASTFGEGSCFTIYLPASIAVESAVPQSTNMDSNADLETKVAS